MICKIKHFILYIFQQKFHCIYYSISCILYFYKNQSRSSIIKLYFLHENAYICIRYICKEYVKNILYVFI